jgi:hypothetical protein
MGDVLHPRKLEHILYRKLPSILPYLLVKVPLTVTQVSDMCIIFFLLVEIRCNDDSLFTDRRTMSERCRHFVSVCVLIMTRTLIFFLNHLHVSPFFRESNAFVFYSFICKERTLTRTYQIPNSDLLCIRTQTMHRNLST